jgi:voltage-dependent calcium channel L type alpha-1D
MQEEAKRQDSIRDRRRESSKVIDLCIRLTENNLWFSASVIAVVLGSEVVIASDQYPISMERTLTMEYLNILVTLLFALELAIRLTASGLENFVKVTKLNIMDAFIVVVSILDVLISTIFLSHDQLINSAAITVLRATRTIRFFKLARYWKSFSVLLENLIETLQNIKTFAVLLIIFLYIYTILGMEFFAHQAKMNLFTYALDPVNGVSPAYHFDNLM